MQQLQSFTYGSNSVRTLLIDEDPWFVLRDVCAVLGITHIVDTAKRLDEDEVGQTEVIDSMGRKQKTYIVSEAGLYNVILRSDKPEAKPFRKWVTGEVLPSIRKTGAYAARPMSPAEMFQLQAQVHLDQERRITALEEQTQQTSARITDVVNAFSVPVFTKDHWQEQANQIINRIVETNHLNHQRYRHKLYDELESTAHCNLETRKKRMQTRMRNGGAKYADVNALSKLAIIAADAKLRAIFEGILRREAALCIAG